ncbi:hypothetical protein [Streptomyces djakartensis]|uniref:Uncharacterized protein n=1 Tax=Streptomyces djakartensis TaxID=68193 RepID=A0ABQ3A3E8_9ACTN|nr:hypothetical protein [Streptomyces djakartensis]GGY31246.1 hypothetical protein GCM10010384_43060 [Streptomyces djakartensis]
MDPRRLADVATPGKLGDYLSSLPKLPATHHAGPATTVRTTVHDGHRIVVSTRYEITVDGLPIGAHLGVHPNGQVHCHALPAYQFLSALAAVRALIDNYPEEFPADLAGPGGGGHGGGHDGGQVHGDGHGGGRHEHGGD